MITSHDDSLERRDDRSETASCGPQAAACALYKLIPTLKHLCGLVRIASASGNVKHRFAVMTTQPNTKFSQIEVFERRNQFNSMPNRMFSFTVKVL